MKISIEETNLQDVKIVRSAAFYDHRGYFQEVLRADEFAAAGLKLDFVQMNQIGSIRHAIRGLHFQWQPPMGKLMRVLSGEVFFVAVDIRPASPQCGQHHARIVRADERIQIWAPAGFARGFCALSDYAEIQYACTGTYHGAAESAIVWNDPDLGIAWPTSQPVLSEKDANAMSFKAWQAQPEAQLFSYPS